jgi:hypothetical protein
MYGEPQSLDHGLARLERKRKVPSFRSEQCLLPRQYYARLLVLEKHLLSTNKGTAVLF